MTEATAADLTIAVTSVLESTAAFATVEPWQDGPVDDVQGNRRRYRITFTDAATGDLVDPDDVTLSIRVPDGTLVELTYPSGGVLRESEGVYYHDRDHDLPGVWKFRWFGFAPDSVEKTVVDEFFLESSAI